MQNNYNYKAIKCSTKVAEGFFISLKFSVIYSLLYAPYSSKVLSLENNTKRPVEFVKSVGRASSYCCVVMMSLFGMR